MDELHPMATHLPIALALVWPLVDLLGLALKRPDVSRVGFGLLILAVVASLFATATGQAAFDEAVSLGIDPKTLNTHADDANLMPWALLLLVAIRWGAAQKLKTRGQVLGIVLGLLLWPFIVGVGRSGGALVYQHGVGVHAPGGTGTSSTAR